MNTLGAHAEAVLNSYLKRGGLTPDEIKQVELVVVPPVNTEQALRQGQIDVGRARRHPAGQGAGSAAASGRCSPTSTCSAPSPPARTCSRERLHQAEPGHRPGRSSTGVAKAIEWTQTHPRDEVVARLKEIIAKRGRNEDTTAVEVLEEQRGRQPRAA